MQAPKNGFFYVLDRATGELIFAQPYVAITWASHVDPATGRPVETPASDFRDEPRLITPGPSGAHNWHPMSFHPGTGLVYVPAHDLQAWYVHDGEFEYRSGEFNLGIDLDGLVELSESDAPELKGHLLAWDPVAQKAIWRVQHAGLWNGGLLSTAGGLVFQGAGDGRFVAYDAASGHVLWEARSQTGIMAPPVSYTANDEQYVAVAAGYGGGIMYLGHLDDAVINDYENEGRVLAFKLGGSLFMPRNAARNQRLPSPPDLGASPEEIAEGKRLYNRHCLGCHGSSVKSSYVVPDLRFLSPERHETFADIVLGGTLSARGMPSFANRLTPDELEPLHAYIVEEARLAYDEQQQAAH